MSTYLKQPILSSTSVYTFSAKVVSSDVEIAVGVAILSVKNSLYEGAISRR